MWRQTHDIIIISILFGIISSLRLHFKRWHVLRIGLLQTISRKLKRNYFPYCCTCCRSGRTVSETDPIVPRFGFKVDQPTKAQFRPTLTYNPRWLSLKDISLFIVKTERAQGEQNNHSTWPHKETAPALLIAADFASEIQQRRWYATMIYDS